MHLLCRTFLGQMQSLCPLVAIEGLVEIVNGESYAIIIVSGWRLFGCAMMRKMQMGCCLWRSCSSRCISCRSARLRSASMRGILVMACRMTLF